jgi:hypothetical protein
VSAFSRPAMMRSSVDLPPPLGPSRAVSWPVGMVTSTSSSATKSPNLLFRPLTSQGWFLGRMMATTTMQATDTIASRKAVA